MSKYLSGHNYWVYSNTGVLINNIIYSFYRISLEQFYHEGNNWKVESRLNINFSESMRKLDDSELCLKII